MICFMILDVCTDEIHLNFAIKNRVNDAWNMISKQLFEAFEIVVNIAVDVFIFD